MTVETDFAGAAERAKDLPTQSNETLLELYGLYKQATQGDVTESRPGLFDFAGQAKYDAWMSRKGMAREDAMIAYVDLVSRLASSRG